LERGFSVPLSADSSDIEFYTLSREAQLGYAEQCAGGGKSRGDDGGDESTPDIGQDGLAIADDIDHGANHVVGLGPGCSECGDRVLGDLVDLGANIVRSDEVSGRREWTLPGEKDPLPGVGDRDMVVARVA
jgi:hypothetical protein